MIEKKKIGVVIPAYNEQLLIEKATSTIPQFVDRIIVVDDGSKDKTNKIIRKLMLKNKKIVLIVHKKNHGLGKALISGYLESLRLDLDITAVMAGDAQMDPHDLLTVLKPILGGTAEYVKGNRLLTEGIAVSMPKFRFFGNSFLTLLTKFATGYWHLIDPQCGYTAISKAALSNIKIKNMTQGYGYNADILNMLNLSNFRVVDVAVNPVYGKEKSKIKMITYMPKVSFLLLRLYWKRMFHKYLVREFHPLIFFYLFSLINIFIIAIPLFIYMFLNYQTVGQSVLIIFAFSLTMGLFSFFFGMWLDMEDNRRLGR